MSEKGFSVYEQRPSTERALIRVAVVCLSLSSASPSTGALLHSRHDLSLPLTTQPTLIHKDKDAAIETAARLGCAMWSELSAKTHTLSVFTECVLSLKHL